MACLSRRNLLERRPSSEGESEMRDALQTEWPPDMQTIGRQSFFLMLAPLLHRSGGISRAHVLVTWCRIRAQDFSPAIYTRPLPLRPVSTLLGDASTPHNVWSFEEIAIMAAGIKPYAQEASFHAYRKAADSLELAESALDQTISLAYPPPKREGPASYSEVEDREDVDVTIVEPSLSENAAADGQLSSVESAPLTDSVEEQSRVKPVQDEVPLDMSSETGARKEQPEDDQAPDHHPQSNLGTKLDGRQWTTGHSPPLLVKEASQKLIDQYLSPAVRADAASDTSKFLSEGSADERRFPAYAEYAALGENAETLPDIIHIPFEDSVQDVVLQGWEDLWFSQAELNVTKWGTLNETKIDFVYTWVNGSETEFQETMYPYEINSTLNDQDGLWLQSHRVNRYRDWDELRYSIRSVEMYASSFRNKIQLLVNSVGNPLEAETATVENPAAIVGKQRPTWLKDDEATGDTVQVLAQEDFFDDAEQGCLPTFNSLTIENQIFNTKSETDRIFALSDDMLLGKPHAASDIYSPLFGPTLGFKSNSYNTVNPPTDLDARRFGEKPFLIYTSWLLNRRFGERKRKGQIHFGHSISRSVAREAINSFPRPALQSACQRFRGETGFQLYSWYVTFHYTIERHREALLWSYIVLRSDVDGSGNLEWNERQTIMDDLEEGMTKEGTPGFRKRMYYHMNEALEEAGLEPPKVNVDVQWTSLDGPAAIKEIECFEFNVNECLAPGFSSPSSDEKHRNLVFSAASIFDRVARQNPKCGDCLLKLILNRVESGLSPLLPDPVSKPAERRVVVKALWKYQYVIVEPDAFFAMVTDAELVENVLFKRFVKRKMKVGQLCLNDDVSTEEEGAVADVREVIMRLLEELLPEPSAFERSSDLTELAASSSNHAPSQDWHDLIKPDFALEVPNSNTILHIQLRLYQQAQEQRRERPSLPTVLRRRILLKHESSHSAPRRTGVGRLKSQLVLSSSGFHIRGRRCRAPRCKARRAGRPVSAGWHCVEAGEGRARQGRGIRRSWDASWRGGMGRRKLKGWGRERWPWRLYESQYQVYSSQPRPRHFEDRETNAVVDGMTEHQVVVGGTMARLL
ncbi:unnamed protein product [Diplocarpon coronariae]